MIVFPNCKINLGLRILKKRRDGYHDLETIFYPLPLTDILEITTYKEYVRSSSMPFTTSGIEVEGDEGNNLCIKAYKLLKKDFPELPHIQMHLHKAIPTGAGLGGGSADAAFTLKVLNECYSLGLSIQQLLAYALQLGSDCPFFIINRPCFATGRGEFLEPFDLDLSAYKLIIVNPGIHINTGKAFLQVAINPSERSVKDIILGPVERWKDELVNDFENRVYKQYPEIVEIKDQLYRAGAIYSSMSGTGSTVYGFFKKEKEISVSFPHHYFVKTFEKTNN